MLLIFIEIKIFTGIFKCFISMMISVKLALIVKIMPVIKIKIMEHGALKKSLFVGMEMKSLVNTVTESGNRLTMLISGDLSVLDILLHLLNAC